MAGLALRDERAERRDLASRSETKFLFSGGDVAAVRAVLRRSAEPIVYAGAVSTVRSVYFDDARLAACRANLDGLGVRNKFRFRWYDRALPEADCWFEIKWRRNLATGKRRFHVQASGRLLDLPLREWPRVVRAAAPDDSAAVLERMQQAVAVVEYKREHFALGRARLTLDYDLRFYPLLGSSHLALRFVERAPELVLVECKAPLEGAGFEQRVLRPLGGRATRFSKYVTACQRLGFAAAN